jgi:hypothetical protein
MNIYDGEGKEKEGGSDFGVAPSNLFVLPFVPYL